MQILREIFEYVYFIIRNILVALVDLYIMYARVGLVWRRRRHRPASMERLDLVMQLAPQSPVHSRISASDMILVLNESFLDRSLWKGLNTSGAQPSAIVTGVSYGGIGFYTALNLILCGFTVHGICRTLKSMDRTVHMIQRAVERQVKLHKEWVGKIGRLISHVCDLSDTIAVSNLCSALLRDPNIRVLVCNAGTCATPPHLSSQRLEQQFATRHVGHSLLMLRLLQGRMQERNLPLSLWPYWRFVVVSCASTEAIDPTVENVFMTHDDESYFKATTNKYSSCGRAEMCRLLFALALSRFIQNNNRLADFCTVNIIHPGPARSRVIPNSHLPFSALLDSEAAALLRISPVVSALYVTDLCLNKRVEDTNGHYFRMGEDETTGFADLQKSGGARLGRWVNSPLFRGMPQPALSLSTRKQDELWRLTLSYLISHGLLEAKVFH
ncbi:retinol dehydrogenase 14 [Trypanosoma theileri]|uniref:Retinol dehydrogenase 14 n=1 Tax=Trypanosoma theileri TaxID=67003 RepID=A0A1X0P177_9TRYP|nr:retinol dehydrogenase 14 [Trypanosoma theileri]ORC90279.1 retinol dehydrogenase 14 [Trypanosoma theileri]